VQAAPYGCLGDRQDGVLERTDGPASCHQLQCASLSGFDMHMLVDKTARLPPLPVIHASSCQHAVCKAGSHGSLMCSYDSQAVAARVPAD